MDMTEGMVHCVISCCDNYHYEWINTWKGIWSMCMRGVLWHLNSVFICCWIIKDGLTRMLILQWYLIIYEVFIRLKGEKYPVLNRNNSECIEININKKLECKCFVIHISFRVSDIGMPFYNFSAALTKGWC